MIIMNNKLTYQSPEIEILSVQTESGFAASFNDPGKENGSWS